jgi:hypothetical protein
MGLFNSIIVDLTCPVTDEVSKDNEIQIKWQSVDTRGLQTYRLGDTLDNGKCPVETNENSWNERRFLGIVYSMSRRIGLDLVVSVHEDTAEPIGRKKNPC